MNKNAWNSVLMMLKSRTAKKRIRQGTVCLSALVVFCITYCLVLPAITMTKIHPSLRAEQTEAVSGEELAFKVTAEAESGEEERIIVLSAEGEGADLSPSYIFNEEGVCLSRRRAEERSNCTAACAAERAADFCFRERRISRNSRSLITGSPCTPERQLCSPWNLLTAWIRTVLRSLWKK